MAVHMKVVGKVKNRRDFKDEDYLKLAKSSTRIDNEKGVKKRLGFIELTLDPKVAVGTDHRVIMFQDAILKVSEGKRGVIDYSINLRCGPLGNPEVTSALFSPNEFGICTCWVPDSEYNRTQITAILGETVRKDDTGKKETLYNDGDIRVEDDEIVKELEADAKKYRSDKDKGIMTDIAIAKDAAELEHAALIADLKEKWPESYYEMREYKDVVEPDIKKHLKRIKKERFLSLQ